MPLTFGFVFRLVSECSSTNFWTTFLSLFETPPKNSLRTSAEVRMAFILCGLLSMSRRSEARAAASGIHKPPAADEELLVSRSTTVHGQLYTAAVTARDAPAYVGFCDEHDMLLCASKIQNCTIDCDGVLALKELAGVLFQCPRRNLGHLDSRHGIRYCTR